MSLACSTTGMYYGGDPPAWTVTPSIPAEGLYRPEAEKRDVKASTSGSILACARWTRCQDASSAEQTMLHERPCLQFVDLLP